MSGQVFGYSRCFHTCTLDPRVQFKKVSHDSCVPRHGPQEMETTVAAVSSFHPPCYTLDVELGKLVRWSLLVSPR